MRADNNWEWTSTLFEFDNRFRVGAGNEFVFFDYSEPGAIPPRLHGTFDLLVGELHSTLPSWEKEGSNGLFLE